MFGNSFFGAHFGDTYFGPGAVVAGGGANASCMVARQAGQIQAMMRSFRLIVPFLFGL